MKPVQEAAGSEQPRLSSGRPAIRVSLRELERHPVSLRGEAGRADLNLDTQDEMVQLGTGLRYEIEVELVAGGVLLAGRLECGLTCRCVRCLRAFTSTLVLNDWTRQLPLEGEDAPRIHEDAVDLTPYLREDTLLALPRHPLCGVDCGGLTPPRSGHAPALGSLRSGEGDPSPWAALNKLRL